MKAPPFSEEAEASVLGALMSSPASLYTIGAHIGPDDFFIDRHRVIFEAATKLLKAGRAADIITVGNVLRDAGRLDDVGGMVYLGEIAMGTPGSANAEDYARIVADRAKRRRVIAYAAALAESAQSMEGDALIASAASGINGMMGSTAEQSVPFQDACRIALEDFDRIGKARAGGVPAGLISGIRPFDVMTGGITGPRLIVIAARPKCGKTALLNQIAIETSMHGKAGLIVSLEMGANELIGRALASYGNMNLSNLMRGCDAEIQRASTASMQMGDLPLRLDTKTFDIDAICAQIAMHKHRYGIQWAAVDHIGLMKSRERFGNRNDLLGHFSWTLKQLAKRCDMPIVALSQLSRACDTENRIPRADDLRDSGNIEQDADMVVMLHTPYKQRLQPEKPVYLGITANRAGPAEWIKEPFTFTGWNQRFTEGFTGAQDHFGEDYA